MIKMLFEVVDDKYRKFPDAEIMFPNRGSKYSAGYDFYSNEHYMLHPGETHIFFSDIKFKCDSDKYLKVVPRSSLAYKTSVIPINTPGTVDADYYSNVDNDGNIGILLHNFGTKIVEIEVGMRIAQGIIEKYYTTDNDLTVSVRQGGIGSTGK